MKKSILTTHLTRSMLIDNALATAQATSAVSRPNLSGKIRKKFLKRPTIAFDLHKPQHHSTTINNTLAGVAQLVERVALITAKRSTSRSWVRAPPSAIPIS